eukprot:CAMPEP_0175820492 /NCGR_PEP_ID=MMETSP0107_2-20121207/8634_1 /TAXON_ID=195067 ORGANISM="Goniomonas pacifica, Strain CCMP1869" /NCGR_SAMPLE_ID=MMETSP0107_2 /ASSEMBLY_ACC=CAM_ASM_000203 /LENGTH=333 /DNA_ID=CAMNT_0017132815 /DNA_START=42 /DNA_END=1043 /DNA_ORIENTATION=-
MATTSWLPGDEPAELAERYLAHQRDNPIKIALRTAVRVQDAWRTDLHFHRPGSAKNSRPVFTRRWLPVGEPKALIFYCPGYGDNVHGLVHLTATNLADDGYAVFSLDYPGMGRSPGVSVYVKSFDNLVRGVSEYIAAVQAEFPGKRSVVVGESMGGAVSIQLHRKFQAQLDAAVLIAPMCRIADDVRPPKAVISMCKGLAKVIPKAKIVPTKKDLMNEVFKDKTVTTWCKAGPFFQEGKPRLRTGNECLRVCEEIDRHMEEVRLPLLVMHGSADTVTDIAASRELVRRASSARKSINEYPGMWHGLTGEPDGGRERVVGDMTGFISSVLGLAE